MCGQKPLQLRFSVVGEFVPEGIHFGECVLVSSAVGGSDAGVQTLEGFFGSIEFGQGLGGHLVGGNVVGCLSDERTEFFQTFVDSGLGDELHGEAVTGEGVGGVLFEDLSEEGEFVHGSIVGGATADKDRRGKDG